MILKLKYLIAIVATLSPIFINPIDAQCVQSPTTVSGRNAPTGNLCSGQLILDENFNQFDRSLWEHEITLGGGGVSMKMFRKKEFLLIELGVKVSHFSIELGISMVCGRSE